MARLRQAMDLLMDTFQEYAGREKDSTMTMIELVKLLRKEFPDEEKSLSAVSTLFCKMDEDSNGVVSFKEFVNIVTEVKLISFQQRVACLR
ncbi:protein S100-G-like [Epinephelus fuscoguttatus]|uniref:protein S100-G-like n=1 Tax=Epinephelus fuscoguttatus TaxID=293821 RepID=UPI0020D15C9A|nr:protein S100-G-like [Epinephelus fuscoguttatus]